MVRVISLASLCALSSCSQRITQVVIDTDPLTIGPDWTQVSLPSSVNAEWDSQIIRLTLNTKFDLSDNHEGIKLEDGSVAHPEADLLTDSGAKHNFSCGGYVGTNSGVDCVNLQLPRGTHFVQLRMRSSRPIVVSKIVWISYMPEDTKTGIPS